MSEIEHVKGRAIEINPVGMSLEDYAGMVLTTEGIELSKYHDSCVDCLLDVKYKEFIMCDNRMFRLVEVVNVDPDGDILNASNHPLGGFSFEVRFYNGGASLAECVVEAIDKLEKKEGSR